MAEPIQRFLFMLFLIIPVGGAYCVAFYAILP
jgi:hypothetical protein